MGLRTSPEDRVDPELRAAMRQANSGDDAMAHLAVAEYLEVSSDLASSSQVLFPYEANVRSLVSGRHMAMILRCAAKRLLPHITNIYRPVEGVLAPRLNDERGHYLGRVALFFDKTGRHKFQTPLGIQVETHHNDPHTFLRQGIRLTDSSPYNYLASGKHGVKSIEIFGGLDRHKTYAFSELHKRPLFDLNVPPSVKLFSFNTVALMPSTVEAGIAENILQALSQVINDLQKN